MAVLSALSGAMQGSSAGPFGAILGAVLGARSGNQQEAQTDTGMQPQLTMDSSDVKNATNYAKITDLGRDYD